jgi:hypothetical protein
MHESDRQLRTATRAVRHQISRRRVRRLSFMAALASCLFHLNALSEPKTQQDKSLQQPNKETDTKDTYTNQVTPKGETSTHFNTTKNLLELDQSGTPSETPEKGPCFSTPEPTSKSLSELNKKAEDCYFKAQDELEAAYKAEKWEKVIRASSSAITVIEWRNSVSEKNLDRITGIGIHIGQDKQSGEAKVLNVAQGSPAEKAGISKNDVISAVNNKNTSELSLDQIVELVRGEAGSEALLTISRKGVISEKKITRAAVSGRRPKTPLGREYRMLHHAYSKLDKVEAARRLYPQARKEVASEFGASSDELLHLLNDQALLVLWDYPKEAASLSNEIIEIIERQNATDKNQRLWGIYNLAGYSLLKAGENEKAAEYIDKAIIYYDQSEKSSSPALSQGLARNVTLLAVFCKYSNIIPAKCKGYSGIAYQMAIKHLSPSQSEYRRALWMRADLLSEAKPIEIWLPLYKQVIELEEKYENLNTRAINLTALAAKLATTETNEAARLQSKAVKLIEKQSGKQSFEALTYQLKVADIYRFGGLRETAYNSYIEIYKRLLQVPGTGEYTDGQRLRIYIELVKGLLPLGKTELVGTLLNKQVEISAKYPEQVEARLALVLAKALHSAFVNRDYSKALTYYAEAEQIFKKLERSYLEPTGKNQEWARGIRQNDIQRARIDLYEDVSAIQALMEDYTAASRTITNAIQYIKSRQSTRTWELKYLYAALSRYQAGQNDLASAERNSQEALNLSLTDKIGSATDDFYLLAGGVAGLLNKPESAYKYFIDFSDERAKGVSAKLWRNPDQSKRIELVDTGLNGSEYIYHDYGDNALYARAALYARLNLHGLSADLEQKQASIATADPKVKEIIATIQSAVRQVTSSNLSSQKKESLSKEIASNEELLLRKMPSLTHKPTSIDEVTKSLPSNAVLIEFQKVSSYPRIDRVYSIDHPKISRYIALSLDHQGTVRRFDVGEADSIDRSIRQAVEALSSGFTDSTQLWSEAGALLLEPLREVLESKSIIYISPDSEISRFPFTDAEVFNPGNILRPNSQIRIVTTGRDIVRLMSTTMIPNKAAVIANPAYSLDTTKQSNSKNAQSTKSATLLMPNKRPDWNELPATDKEGAEVSRLIDAELLSKGMANEQAVKNLVSPKVLHFASHAFFLEEANASAEGNGNDIQGSQLAVLSGVGLNSERSPASQIRSGIVLAGANDPPKNQELDGYLTADEIARLGWLGTELVVVSGCDSAVGIPRSGDGLYGLRRSIAVAGARSSLLSLWKVEDVATAEFMTKFYARLKAGSARSDALAETQKDFRDGIAGNGRWKDPYYWAAWQLVGDWRPIPDL